jgi:hypothetical protein
VYKRRISAAYQRQAAANQPQTAAYQRWSRSARRPKPAGTSMAASLKFLTVAWAGRERIFSRIRSMPSAPGST